MTRAKMVDDFIINSIREKTDIAEVVNQYVRLKKRGQNYLGLCPFHQEKTPSFTVNSVKNIWHCFGCGAGGNVFHFLMKMEQLSFPETLQLLATRTGVELPESSRDRFAEKQSVQPLYDCLKAAHEFYRAQMKDERASSYVSKRGLAEQTLETFALGYTGPKGTTKLHTQLSKSFSDQVLLDSGLFVQTSHGLAERFTDRLMFPIFDLQNRLIAFGGRTLGSESAKYINSPETPIYHKSQHLYGLSQVKPFIKEADSLVIVEGYMDAISLFEAGVKNVVAVLGTSFTIQQARLAERFSNKLFLCFDSDDAGRKAVERSLEVIAHTHCEVKVIDLLDQKDPDDFIRIHGKEGFDQQKDFAFPLIKYMIYAVARRFGADTKRLPIEDKLRMIKEIRSFLTEQDDLIRSEYIGLIATLLDLDIELIKSKFYDYSLFNMKLKHLPVHQKKQDKYFKLEQEVLSILVSDPILRKAHLSDFSEDDFESEHHQPLYRFLADHLSEPVDNLVNLADPERSRQIAQLAMLEPVEQKAPYLREAMKSFAQRRRDQKVLVLLSEIKRLEKLGDFDKLQQQQAELSKLIRQP